MTPTSLQVMELVLPLEREPPSSLRVRSGVARNKSLYTDRQDTTTVACVRAEMWWGTRMVGKILRVLF